MLTFKSPKNARSPFQQKRTQKVDVDNIKQEPSTLLNIKQECLPYIPVRCDMNIIKREHIKTECSPDESNAMNWETSYNFNPEPKHDISNLLADEEIKYIPVRLQEQNYVSDSGRGTGTKNIPPKKKNYINKNSARPRRRPQYLTAVNVHKHLSSQDPNSLTVKQLDSLTWAESVITGAILRRLENDSAVPIEVPDDENNNNNNQLNEAFIISEPIPILDTFQLAIVDFANPGGRYSLVRARLIEKTLSKAVVTHILQHPTAKQPVFGKSVYYDGVLVLDCKDQAAYDFAKLALCDIKLWDGSKLKMVQPEKCPFASIGYLHLPDVDIEKNKILEVLKTQNPSITIHNWKILGETRLKTGFREYSILMSDPPIYFQKHQQLRLFFGGSEVILKNYGCQWLWNCKV